MSKFINNLVGCSKLEDRSLTWNGKTINQKCSRKCENVIKKGSIFKLKKYPSSEREFDIRDKPNLCGYEHKTSKGIKSKHIFSMTKQEKDDSKRLCKKIRGEDQKKRYVEPKKTTYNSMNQKDKDIAIELCEEILGLPMSKLYEIRALKKSKSKNKKPIRGGYTKKNKNSIKKVKAINKKKLKKQILRECGKEPWLGKLYSKCNFNTIHDKKWGNRKMCVCNNEAGTNELAVPFYDHIKTKYGNKIIDKNLKINYDIYN